MSTRNVYAICNIETTGAKLPTAAMIDDAIADVHGSPADTMILCHPKCRNMALAPFKASALQVGVEDKEYNRTIDTWSGVPVITSYNLSDGAETATVF